ncbi:MAG TPA: alpha/beta hydrolase [Pyrinomonadaceae bacterium]|nr:alpha/beta hydrolase [Pyrinomonadaceae bacterium]
MPSIQAKAINIVLYVIRMKRTVNRMRERVANGQRTYTEPSRGMHRKHRISKREVNGHLVWTLAPKENASEKYVIYLHGGAFVNSFAAQHWTLMSKLIDALNCTVVAPNYPHAPEHCVTDVFDLMVPLYNEVAARVGSANITLMGDSSGGGISLALAQRLREDGYEQPAHVVLLSPWLDATLSNPEIVEFDRVDPFLGVDGLKYGGAAYARDVDPKSYLVSPVHGSLKSLAPITLFIGTRDILYPDCRKLWNNATAEGVKINFREYKGMVHNWMLGPMPEAKHAIQEIISTIK